VLCKYELEAVCTCPVDSRGDYYRVTVESVRVIPVEDIQAAVKEEGATKQFQEKFTEGLSRRLGAKVTTVGFHSAIKTTVICGGE
jgi:hypothetical protein